MKVGNTEEIVSGVLIRIKGMWPSLKKAEKKVAQYILNDPNAVKKDTVAKMATASNVSEATIVRFCRTIGYSGFQELKIQLAMELYAPNKQLASIEVKSTDSTSEIMRKVFSFNIKTLNETAEVLDPNPLNMAAELLGRANRILIVGVGTSSANVQDAHNKFFRLGLNSVAESDSHLQLMEAALLGKRDVVLAITHSGRTKDPVDTLRIAKKTGARTIAITSDPGSPITEFSDVVLLTSSAEGKFRKEALASRLAQMSIIDVLHTIVGIKHKARANIAKKKIEAVVGQKQILEYRQ